MKLFKNYRKELEETERELVIAQKSFIQIKKYSDELNTTNLELSEKIEKLNIKLENAKKLNSKLKKEIKSLNNGMVSIAIPKLKKTIKTKKESK